MNNCTRGKSQELNKQQRLVRIIMEEGERIHKMKDSVEKKRQEEILSFLVEFQSIIARSNLNGLLLN